MRPSSSRAVVTASINIITINNNSSSSNFTPNITGEAKERADTAERAARLVAEPAVLEKIQQQPKTD
jgi:hypothetical protein